MPNCAAKVKPCASLFAIEANSLVENVQGLGYF